MGIAASIPYFVAAVMELGGGKLFDTLYRKGASINQLRWTGMGIGMFGAALFIWLCMPANAAFWGGIGSDLMPLTSKAKDLLAETPELKIIS